MKQKFSQFSKEGNWYKANFHAHSTNSDGLLTPEEMIFAYKKQGYSILMFSEHEIYTNTTELDTSDFLVYPGIERSIMLPDKETFHIQGIYDPESKTHYQNGHYIPVPEYTSMKDVQNIIDSLKENGNFVMINHPYWSFNTFSHLNELNNYDFMEVYNHNCHMETDLGNSEPFYDDILKYKKIGVLATDDNHNSHRYEKGIHMWDSFGGFTMIQAEKLTREAIGKALKEGKFYASTGPSITQFQIDGDTVSVDCSPCNSIVFKAQPRRGYRVLAEDKPLTHATYKLRGGEKWIRVKCIDKDGNCAWSNPIYIED